LKLALLEVGVPDSEPALLVAR